MQEQLDVDAWFAALAITSSVTPVIIRNALINITVCRIFYNFIFILIIWPTSHSLATRGVPLLDQTKAVYHFRANHDLSIVLEPLILEHLQSSKSWSDNLLGQHVALYMLYLVGIEPVPWYWTSGFQIYVSITFWLKHEMVHFIYTIKLFLHDFKICVFALKKR